jgi:hypothetical protein
MLYTVEDCYPQKGKIDDCTNAEQDYNGRQGKEICYYQDSPIQSITNYNNDSIVETYVLINKDTFNRTFKNKKIGKWIEYIPRFEFVRYHYYFDNCLKYTFVIYVGEDINIKLNSGQLSLIKGDTLQFCCYDKSFCTSNNISKPLNNFEYCNLYQKHNFHSISKNRKTYMFYKDNKIAATFEFNNLEQQVDSIYNINGELILTRNLNTREYKLIGSQKDLDKFQKHFLIIIKGFLIIFSFLAMI